MSLKHRISMDLDAVIIDLEISDEEGGRINPCDFPEMPPELIDPRLPKEYGIPLHLPVPWEGYERSEKKEQPYSPIVIDMV